MLIRFLEYKDIEEQDINEVKFLNGYYESEFDKLFNMLNQADKLEKPLVIEVNSGRYEVLDFAFFPAKTPDSVRGINVYVGEIL